MGSLTKGAACVGAIWFAFATAGAAQQAPAPAPEVLRLWSGPAPGTENWGGPETDRTINPPGGPTLHMVSNVTTPTLTVYRPQPGKANGAAMIVCPGGGFQNLAMTHEGELVARWLADRGVTAFVLKYRVRPTPGFHLPDARRHPEQFDALMQFMDPGRRIAETDAIQAMRMLRKDPARFGIAPDRIGMIGFSAGAILTMSVVMDAAPADRPDLAAPIYGAMDHKPAPGDAPPLFVAAAQDDPAVPVGRSLEIFSRWTEAGRPAELHVYERGGHGFGMVAHKTTVDTWTVAFEAWLKMHGWMS